MQAIHEYYMIYNYMIYNTLYVNRYHQIANAATDNGINNHFNQLNDHYNAQNWKFTE